MILCIKMGEAFLLHRPFCSWAESAFSQWGWLTRLIFFDQIILVTGWIADPGVGGDPDFQT